MKYFVTIPIFCALLSCSSEKRNVSNVPIETPTQSAKQVDIAVEQEDLNNLTEPTLNKYTMLDSAMSAHITTLEKDYASVPFYTRPADRTYFIVSTGKYEYRMKRFDGTLKYGLVDDSLHMLLKQDYDKIYNPNQVLEGCFEIKWNDKVGLYNYQTGDVIQPQFDYIIPEKHPATSRAFGYKDNTWFEIEAANISVLNQIDFDPTRALQGLSFNINHLGENMMYDSYYEYYEDDANVGKGVVVVPSYIEYFKLLNSASYTDVILPDQVNLVDFGTEEAKLQAASYKQITDKLISFFVEVYEQGIDGRGYQIESQKLMLYNEDQQVMNVVPVGSVYDSYHLCNDAGYRFVNDSIIEIKSTDEQYGMEGRLYNFETKYTYRQVMSDGSIKKLESDRYFDFTKFILIDSSHFQGCYAKYMGEEAFDEYNIWVSDHLTVEDLDIMRNEIFAEYGYKFQTEKWHNYFMQKKWYEPRFDDVNDQLSEIDRANIKVILELKQRMQEDEQRFVNKKPSTYYAAG